MTPEQLRALITRSGLSVSRWARMVVGRDPRTVQRWLAGETMPASVTQWLDRLVDTTVSDDAMVITMRLVPACLVRALRRIGDDDGEDIVIT